MHTQSDNATINAQPFGYTKINTHTYYALYYIMAYNSLIKTLQGLYRHDIAILVNLHDRKEPLSWGYILSIINSTQTEMNYGQFSEAIERLVDKGYVIRKRQSKFVNYTITDTGRAFLYTFAVNLEQLVKERILKFAKD